MPAQGRSVRLFAVFVVASALVSGCLRPMARPGADPPVTVTIDDNCIADKDPAKIYFDSPGKPKEVIWYIEKEADWTADIIGWDEEKYEKKKKNSKSDAGKKVTIFRSNHFHFPAGVQTNNSGKPRHAAFKVNNKWPRWEYDIVITRVDGSEKCRVKDPGVCIRGGNGSCEY